MPHTDIPKGTHPPPQTALPPMPTLPHAPTAGQFAGVVSQQQPSQPEKLPVNFDLFSNKEEIDRQLSAVEARMRDMNYDEQKIQVRNCCNATVWYAVTISEYNVKH